MNSSKRIRLLVEKSTMENVPLLLKKMSTYVKQMFKIYLTYKKIQVLSKLKEKLCLTYDILIC